MIFDTDMLIWVQRGNANAAAAIDAAPERSLSLQSYMELLQCARDKRQHMVIKRFLTDFGFIVLPLTEPIGHRALIYIESYSLAYGIRAGDALVAATAVENGMPLMTSNAKHFGMLNDLDLHVFTP